MNRSYAARVLLVLIFAASLTLTSIGCGKNCEQATTAVESSIRTVCEGPEFRNSPFCACCVPNGYYSIDDTCQCQPLIFDTNFCLYDGTEAGYPAVADAVSYAASVCQDRGVSVPYIDVNTSTCPSRVVPVMDGGVDGPADGPSDRSVDTGPDGQGAGAQEGGPDSRSSAD
jgi:hypothetical protein